MPRIRFMEIGHASLSKPAPIVKDIKINPQIRELLQQPTWSVSSLLPPRTPKQQENQRQHQHQPSKKTRASPLSNPTPPPPIFQATQTTVSEITPSKLRHLLKLSALPAPSSPAEEASMLSTLRSQVHFVREIQKVDTSGVAPLVAIRDETRDHVWASMVTEESLAQYFVQEDRVGTNGTVRRQRDNAVVISGDEEARPFEIDGQGRAARDVVHEPFEMGRADADGPGRGRRTAGRFFYVKRGRKNDINVSTPVEGEGRVVEGGQRENKNGR
ncbi:hypothetical protein LTR84_008817 [Exophiala bonariae]|uniref:Glutamyl-tRNA amidotransferase complex subunit Gta3 domain-containing protein n=1 Tax=Exophiala bonariae TaxID=1690606 RepID=A0AAV9MWD8_9EURO|nr:hypothetical protein LTR84_008817 [Exophiala bonariae]